MELRFFRCKKCGGYLAGVTDKENIQCGMLVGFTVDETPYGCGGTLVETTREEVIEAAYRERDEKDDY